MRWSWVDISHSWLPKRGIYTFGPDSECGAKRLELEWQLYKIPVLRENPGHSTLSIEAPLRPLYILVIRKAYSNAMINILIR